MHTYHIESNGKTLFSVQASDIHMAMVLTAEKEGAVIINSTVHSEDLAGITISKGGEQSKIMICAEKPATIDIHTIAEELLA